MLERLSGSGKRELLDAVRAPSLLRIVEVRQWIPALELGGFAVGDTWAEQALPEGRFPETAGSHDAVAGDGYSATHGHQSLLMTKS